MATIAFAAVALGSCGNGGGSRGEEVQFGREGDKCTRGLLSLDEKTASQLACSKKDYAGGLSNDQVERVVDTAQELAADGDLAESDMREVKDLARALKAGRPWSPPYWRVGGTYAGKPLFGVSSGGGPGGHSRITRPAHDELTKCRLEDDHRHLRRLAHIDEQVNVFDPVEHPQVGDVEELTAEDISKDDSVTYRMTLEGGRYITLTQRGQADLPFDLVYEVHCGNR